MNITETFFFHIRDVYIVIRFVKSVSLYLLIKEKMAYLKWVKLRSTVDKEHIVRYAFETKTRIIGTD